MDAPEDQTPVPALEEIVSGLVTKGVRQDKESGRLSVLDILKAQGKRYPSMAFQRLKEKYPDLSPKIEYFQFPGERQTLTPTIDPRNVSYLLKVLASKSPSFKKPEQKPKPPLLAVVAGKQGILLEEDDHPAPYGWRWDAGWKIFAPVHSEQRTVKYCLQLRAFGFKTKEIARQLDADEIFPRDGGKWHPGDVEALMEFDHKTLFKQHEKFWREWRYRMDDE